MDILSLMPWLKSAWTVWFLLVFVGIVVSVYWPGRKREFEARGRIPFERED